jgi:hypothetical protein
VSGIKAVHVFWWGLVSALVMAIGAFGPWAKILGLVTVNGTDNGGDGWVVIVGAVLGGIAFALWRAWSRNWLVVSALAAAAALATTIYDRVDLERTTANGVDVGSLIDAGWGIYIAMLGSLSLGIASVVGWILASEAADTAVV